MRWNMTIISDEKLLGRLLLALVLLNVADMLATIWGIEMGLFIEANPLLRWCIDQGLPLFVMVKMFLCVQFVVVAMMLSTRIRHFTMLTSILVVLYSAVVIRSFGLLMYPHILSY
jgi:hypothetical protein